VIDSVSLVSQQQCDPMSVSQDISTLSTTQHNTCDISIRVRFVGGCVGQLTQMLIKFCFVCINATLNKIIKYNSFKLYVKSPPFHTGILPTSCYRLLVYTSLIYYVSYVINSLLFPLLVQF